MTRQPWRLPPLGANRAVSMIRSKTSSVTGSGRYSRTAPVDRNASFSSTVCEDMESAARQTRGGDVKVNPDAAGLDADRLERITNHFERRYIAPQKIAGCQVAVARHGQVRYLRSFGSMDLERGKVLGDDTIFRIYSMTKPIT